MQTTNVNLLETPPAAANRSGTYAKSWLLDTSLWHTKDQSKYWSNNKLMKL